MTEIQLGKVMLTFKGEYDNTKTYIRLDAVTYQGSSYVCLSDTSSAPPGDSWQLLADKGADGQPGKDGQPGSPGVTPHIDATTGNWFIGTTNIGVKAQGPAGQNGSDGKPGSNGSDGKPGADGVTPHIDSATGHWFVGTTDTGVSARGPQGQQGSPDKDGQTPDVSNLATKTDLANYYTKTETDTKLSTKADKSQLPDMTGYAKSSDVTSQINSLQNQVSLANQVKAITSGTLDDLAGQNGSYHYEIDFIPSDSPTHDRGLLDVVVGANYAKQVFTNTANSDVYVRTRKQGVWSDWRQITLWN